MEVVNDVLQKLNRALELRGKRVRPYGYVGPEVPTLSSVTLNFGHDGIMHVTDADGKLLSEIPSLAEFYEDSNILYRIRCGGPVATYCHQRLRLMQTRFELYTMLCHDREQDEVAIVGHRDFYNVRKVDTHIHHSAAMNGKHLLRFMKKKLKSHSDDIVDHNPDGTGVILRDVFNKLGITWDGLSLDRLQVWADKTCMHRFDRFNNKYSPMGQNALRTVFLKTDNAMGGRYLAELTKEMIDDLEESKYQHVEWRLSIYGRKPSEWENLSRWVLGRGKGLGQGRALLSPNVRWMIQIPRLFALYRETGMLTSFKDMLQNIFEPIFEATLHPEKYPEVADFLKEVSGFDSVDDESASSGRTFSSKDRMPGDWDIAENPSYRYYCFYIWANIRILNDLRAMRGMNQFAFRPHAGEAGEVHHLDTAFLLADGINHGVNLRKSPALEYLFFLANVGIAMSPCSNNQLFLHYEKSPFPTYFARGLNVSLSTDDPLMFHQTKEPLMEEYSIAKQLWHLTSVDLCEIARNSVLQSGFLTADKEHWLGCKNYWEECSVSSSNVPPLRRSFRRQQRSDELSLLLGSATLAEMDSNIAEKLLLSPRTGSNSKNSNHQNGTLSVRGALLAAAVEQAKQGSGSEDPEDSSELIATTAHPVRDLEMEKTLRSPLPEDGLDQTDSDLLEGEGQDQAWNRHNFSPDKLLAQDLQNFAGALLSPESARRRSQQGFKLEDPPAKRFKRT
mmetsp:Transcript_37262/g.79099  ORF Transcript_37262/g.79099 Transcript_37262/m.79099 type:complete len:731 (-) Transcript_37262:262-2454(-)|eukprot:CAMPEP_0206450048 /NCGR_PEP_ID=MMETSP0324_2-20121206/18477_1 /ASSEMBLY_ACC=CAM_ASM_000836 /TAXON_ID=2866 /ORGANISM="Crypthecodinium cohnii, Strain Seligo" /LENGTH=730 /DNA_ID=CAMNT_0053919591 /DNA_START=212 /DNA_END=2404 /DNA_ORIENTATION=-